MDSKAPLSRRSFLARVTGGALLAGGLGLARRAAAQPAPFPNPAPMPRPTVIAPSSLPPALPVPEPARRRSRQGNGRFRPCRFDSDSGSAADPRCHR
jgi:hypothetical protein